MSMPAIGGARRPSSGRSSRRALEVVRLFLGRGAALDARDEDGNVALHGAVGAELADPS